MTQPASTPIDLETGALEVDIRLARSSRIGDYLLGGRDNFPIDRTVTDYITASLPGGNDTARAIARATQACVGRILRYLATEAGIDQFLHIGTGVPTKTNLDEIVVQLPPNSRVVSVVSDPVVVAHARSLLARAQQSMVYVHASLRDPEDLLRQASATLDESKPIAVLAFRVLQLVESHDDGAVYEAVARLMDGVASGSYLAITHLASDIHPDELAVAADRYRQMLREEKMSTLVPRSHADVSGFFDGLELVEPGVVPTIEWRPDAEVRTGEMTPPVYAGLGRKP